MLSRSMRMKTTNRTVMLAVVSGSMTGPRTCEAIS